MMFFSRNSLIFWTIGCSTLFALGCEESSKKSPAAGPIPANGSTSEAIEATNADESSRGYFLGFDGKNDFSILLTDRQTYTLKDPSLATIKKETVKLSTATIDELIAEVKMSQPDFNETSENLLRQFLGCENSATRITPLKAGRTTLQSTRTGGGGNSNDRFGGQTTPTMSLVVYSYTPDLYEAGKARYTTDGAGNLKACKSCHETGDEDAPPHELGGVSDGPDSQILKWVTTGQTEKKTARINHTWEFSNEQQKQGIVPYLRAKASKDIQTFTKLVFEERLATFKENGNRIPGLPGGGQGGGGSAPAFRCPPTGGNGGRGPGR